MGDVPRLPAATAHQYHLDIDRAPRAIRSWDPVLRLGGRYRRDHYAAELARNPFLGPCQQDSVVGDVRGCRLVCRACDPFLASRERRCRAIFDPAFLRSAHIRFPSYLECDLVCRSYLHWLRWCHNPGRRCRESQAERLASYSSGLRLYRPLRGITGVSGTACLARLARVPKSGNSVYGRLPPCRRNILV